MISACKSGSAKSITGEVGNTCFQPILTPAAVMPYFPYSRQSKKKTHRGSITARMIANQLEGEGVKHVITIDLHASQMQGFFHCPIENLPAEPLLAHWIKMNIPGWGKAMVVSKNAGGIKRVTSLADALKINFGVITTERRRSESGRVSVNTSIILDDHKTSDRSNGYPPADDVGTMIPPVYRASRGARIGQDEQSSARSHPSKHLNIRKSSVDERVTGNTIRTPKADPVKHGPTGVQTASDTRRLVVSTSEDGPGDQVSILCIACKLCVLI